jgi:hypothetical protein
MTQDTGFDSFTDAPAPLGLADLEVAGQAADEAPTPMDIGTLGSITGDAPAPAPLEGDVGVGETGEGPPAPSEAVLTGAGAGEFAADAPSPHGGPGDIELGSLEAAEDVETGGPTPMDLEGLQALEG